MKKEYWGILLLGIFLILFAVFINKINFHDSPEYITIAKNFAGVDNIDLFSTHSLLYPLIISPFLKIWPSLIMLRLVNCLWLFLIALTLFFIFKDKKAFIIFAFSPLIWYVSVQTTPILPASLFFLLAYFFLKKENLKAHLFYSGFFIGLACAVYDPSIFVSFVFVLVYFWDKKFYSTLGYLISILIGFLPRMILDYSLFHMPFYSLIRFFGTNMIVSLGLYPGTTNIHFLSNLGVFAIIVIISPFLFRLYKLWGQEKRDLIFILIAGILILVRCAMLKYFLLIAPIAVILLGKALTNKEIKWHCILSVVLIIFMTFNYFIPNADAGINKDIKSIIKDYPGTNYLIVYPGNDANLMACFSWEDEPRFAWYQDFEASIQNETTIREYNFGFNSKIRLRDKLVISASFNRFSNQTYDNYILISKQKDEVPKNFVGDRCYEVLCTFKDSSA